jgi:hypothetical protein
MIREGGKIRVKVGTGELRPGSLWVEVERAVIEHLEDWSAPVCCKVDDGVLTFRRSTPEDDRAVHIGRKPDDQRWPVQLPAQPLGGERSSGE